LYNKELHKLHSSPNIITIIKSRKVRKPEGKRPLGRPRCRWDDNMKMDLTEIGWGGMDLIHLPQDRDQWKALVDTVMNLWIP
jgi:hypothetical protein